MGPTPETGTKAERLHRQMLIVAQFLYRHSLTLLALTFAVVVLTGVRQVSHVVFHLPAINLHVVMQWHGWLVVAFWLFVIVLLSAYGMFLAYLTPVEPGGLVDRAGAAVRSWWCGVAVGLAAGACLMLTLTGLPGSDDTNLLAGLALGLPIAWLLAAIKHPIAEWFVDVPWRLAGAPRRPITSRCAKMAAAALVVCAILFVVRIYSGYEWGGWQPGNGFLGIAIGFCLWLLAGRLHAVCWPGHIERT
ncbi:MAG: hypothetical protein NZO58_14705, partial [Gemmataceae bacterium]|nr:hypothetical protein [Gemmataceae bacterium]